MTNDLDLWFAEQILPHEGALTAYLRRVWPDAAEIADLRQEVYVRVYDAAAAKRPAVARYFLFTVARNLLTDRLRHRRVVTIDLMEDLSSLGVLSDDVPADRILSGRQELARLEAALAGLPPRCYPDEFHIFWQPMHRLAAYARSMAWFYHYLKGRNNCWSDAFCTTKGAKRM